MSGNSIKYTISNVDFWFGENKHLNVQCLLLLNKNVTKGDNFPH